MENFAKKIDHSIPENLQGLVVGFILGKATVDVKQIIPIFPTGYPLMVNFIDDIPILTIDGKEQPKSERLVIAGQIFRCRIHSEFQGHFGQLGIVLHPTALYYLFHENGISFNNKWTAIEDASLPDPTSLIKELHKTSEVKVRLDLILNYLQMLLQDRKPAIEWLDKCLLKISHHKGKIEIRHLLSDSGLSVRHFRRVFKQIIGIPPKYYCKIIQLNAVFELIKKPGTEKLHFLALDCGYYDQAHFIKDFQSMIGQSPEDFLQGKHSFIKEYMGEPGN